MRLAVLNEKIREYELFSTPILNTTHLSNGNRVPCLNEVCDFPWFLDICRFNSNYVCIYVYSLMEMFGETFLGEVSRAGKGVLQANMVAP